MAFVIDAYPKTKRINKQGKGIQDTLTNKFELMEYGTFASFSECASFSE